MFEKPLHFFPLVVCLNANSECGYIALCYFLLVNCSFSGWVVSTMVYEFMSCKNGINIYIAFWLICRGCSSILDLIIAQDFLLLTWCRLRLCFLMQCFRFEEVHLLAKCVCSLQFMKIRILVSFFTFWKQIYFHTIHFDLVFHFPTLPTFLLTQLCYIYICI